jgi:hypothetical protein
MKGRVVLVVLPRVATKRGVPVIALAECFREMLDVQECQCQTAAPRGIRRGSRIADENNSISGGRFDPAIRAVEFGERPDRLRSGEPRFRHTR